MDFFKDSKAYHQCFFFKDCKAYQTLTLGEGLLNVDFSNNSSVAGFLMSPNINFSKTFHRNILEDTL